MLAGDLAGAGVGRRGVNLPGQQRLVPLGQIGLELVGLGRRDQHLPAVLVRVHRQIERRVQLLEFIDGHAGQFGGDVDIHMLAGGYGDEIGLVGEFVQAHAELGRIIENIAYRQQLGRVISRLVGHADILVSHFLSAGLQAGDGAGNIALAPVIGGQRDIPVAELRVQVFQIIQRGAGGFGHIAATVVPPGLLQAVLAAGGRHELPQAGGADMGLGGGYEGAFHQWQQRQFGGHAAALHLVHDVKQIFSAAVQRAAEIFRLAGIKAFLAPHDVGIHFRQLETFARAFPNIIAIA